MWPQDAGREPHSANPCPGDALSEKVRFPQYWPFPANSRRAAVNQKDARLDVTENRPRAATRRSLDFDASRLPNEALSCPPTALAEQVTLPDACPESLRESPSIITVAKTFQRFLVKSTLQFIDEYGNVGKDRGPAEPVVCVKRWEPGLRELLALWEGQGR
jgi:hypothetical protein